MSISRRLPTHRAKFAERFKWSPRVGHLLDQALERLEKVTQGHPQKHQETHLQGGRDPFPDPGVPQTIDPNLGASAGTATNYARADGRAAIDLKLTTKGDLLTRTSSAYVRQPGGSAEGEVLTWDPAETTGMKWAAPAGADAAVDPADSEAGGILSEFTLRQAIEVYAHRVSLAKNFR